MSETTEKRRTAPRQTAGAAPLRRPESLRRTSSIDASWPEGRGGKLRLMGRARDIFTPASGGAPIICAEDAFEVWLNSDRTIASVQAEPPRPDLVGIVGARAGGGLRQVIDQFASDERRQATPLYLILDDISGASLVSGWAWSQWDPNWMENSLAALKHVDLTKAYREREGVCIGFTPGSSAFNPKQEKDRLGPLVPDLRREDDPDGWHAFTAQEGVGARRARRIDIWFDDNITIDSAFQDSATRPEGGRAVVHEYTLRAVADAQSTALMSVEATPRILPFPECTFAADNIVALIDTPLSGLRRAVLAQLRGPAGCTHLNDALRALADVPSLVTKLQAQLARGDTRGT